VVFIRFENSKIDASVFLPANGLIFFSVPFDSGWSAYIDDKLTPLELADFGFMALNATAGNHQISLRFLPPFFSISLAIAAVGVVAFLVLSATLIKTIEIIEKYVKDFLMTLVRSKKHQVFKKSIRGIA